MNAAEAPIVAFTDDDTYPPVDWLASISAIFAEYSSAVCVEGSVSGGITYTGERQYVGCNMAVQKKNAVNVGGWNSCYAGWREDTEFG